MEASRVYRSRRGQGWVVLACSVPFFLVGLGAVYGPDGWTRVFYAGLGTCGMFVAAVGAGQLRTRVEVGPTGITRHPRLLGGFILPWEAVTSWSLVDLRDDRDVFSARAVRLVRGWRRFEVWEANVCRPGFDLFVQDLRAWAGNREVAPLATG